MMESCTAAVKFGPARNLYSPGAWQMMEQLLLFGAADMKSLFLFLFCLSRLADPQFPETYKSLFQIDYNGDVNNVEENVNGNTVFL